MLHFAIQGGLWLFLLPVFASVGHRMIPFFTSSAIPHRGGAPIAMALILAAVWCMRC